MYPRMSNDEKKFDAVSRPAHYNAGGVECIDALAAATVNLTGIEAVCTANAIKYLWRWKMKNGVEDLHKAIWYINRIIAENPKSLPTTQVKAPMGKCLNCGNSFGKNPEMGDDYITNQYCSSKCMDQGEGLREVTTPLTR